MRFFVAILLLLLVAPASAQQGQGMSKALVVSSCGGGALLSGAVNQLTMNPAGQLCLSGIGSSCPQATSYLGRTVGGNEGGNAANIVTLICGLVSDGVWSKLDALYILAQQNHADALLNLVGTSYTGIENTLMPFTAYQGVTGQGHSDWVIDTHFNPVTAGGNYTLNNASMGAWIFNSRTTADATLAAMGNNGASGDAIIWPLGGSSKLTGNVNDGAYMSSTATLANARGWTVVDRAASSSFSFYKNGALFETEAVPSTGMTSASIFLLSINNNGTPLQSTTDTLSAAHIGSSLGASGQLALYNRLRTYMTAVGVP